MVTNHMRKRGIDDSLMLSVNIVPLWPRGKDVSTLSFVSFKLDVNGKLADKIMAPNFWPAKCQIKPFIDRSRTKIANKYADLTESAHNDDVAFLATRRTSNIPN